MVGDRIFGVTEFQPTSPGPKRQRKPQSLGGAAIPSAGDCALCRSAIDPQNRCDSLSRRRRKGMTCRILPAEGRSWDYLPSTLSLGKIRTAGRRFPQRALALEDGLPDFLSGRKISSTPAIDPRPNSDSDSGRPIPSAGDVARGNACRIATAKPESFSGEIIPSTPAAFPRRAAPQNDQLYAIWLYSAPDRAPGGPWTTSEAPSGNRPNAAPGPPQGLPGAFLGEGRGTFHPRLPADK